MSPLPLLVRRPPAAMTIYDETDASAEIPKAVELLLSQFPPHGS